VTQKILIGFGFWRSLFEPLLPDPAWFVDTEWSAHERALVIHYLEQGQPINYWMGSSWCRFGCKEAGLNMGATDMTDGIYCWPQGLVHYIYKHQLRLPSELVQYILTQPEFPTVQAAAVPDCTLADYSWWITQKGWNDNTTDFSEGSEAADRQLLRRFNSNNLDFGNEPEAAKVARRQLLDSIRRKWQ
jgi:hypothetical protein